MHNRRCLSDVNAAIRLGLSNTNVADADSNSGLQSKVTALSTHAEYAFAKTNINVGIRDAGTIGVAADSDISGLTTTAGAQALFTAEESGLAAGYSAGLSHE